MFIAGEWDGGRDEDYAQLATPTDACREYARKYGAEYPERAWISTHYDSWEKNPHYQGPPQPHPEEANDGNGG